MTFISATASIDPCRAVPSHWESPEDWQRHYPRALPLHVDVGAGKGRFLLERARTHPEVNFLGIERMLGRVRKIGGKAKRGGLQNLRLLRLEGYYAVRHLFAPGSVDVFYVFFPDPWPKAHHGRNRICNPEFLDAMHRALRPGGLVHFATDHLGYFAEVVELFQAAGVWQPAEPLWPTEAERSDFERVFLRDSPIGRFSARRCDSAVASEPVNRP